MAEELVFVADIDIRKWEAKLKRMDRRMENFEKSGTQAVKNIQTTGTQRFRQLGFALQRFGLGGAAAFGEIFVAAGAAGVAIGGVLIQVNLVIQAFTTLFNVAKRAMEQIIKLGVEAAKEYEIAEAQFTAVFKGGRKEAQATIHVLKELSRSVGQNVTGIARAFLPEVEDLDQLERVVNIGVALARAQPEQGEFGARISLLDALSGEFRSLQRRFEFTDQAVARIKAAFDEAGIEGLLQEIEKELERTGRSVDDLSDTFEVALGRVRETARQTAAILGEPIVAQLKEELNDFLEFFKDARSDIDLAAKGIGEIIAELIDDVGDSLQGIAEGIDLNDILAVFDDLADVGERLIRVLVDILSQEGVMDSAGVEDVTGSINEFARSLEIILALTDDLRGIFDVDILNMFGNVGGELGRLTDILGFFGSGLESTEEGANALHDAIASLSGVLDAFSSLLANTSVLLGVATGQLTLMEAGAIAAGGAVQAYEAGVERMNEALEKNTRLTLDNIEAIETATEEDIEAANAKKRRIKAEEDLASLLTKIADSEAELAEKRGEFDAAAASRFAKIELDAQRRRLDSMIENARKRIDIEEKMFDKLEDLRINYNNKTEALATDLDRDLEDITINNARKELKIEMDLNEERRSLEEDHLRRLEEIRRKFDFQAQEAIRANDAIAFLRIRRRMEFELNEERIRRDDSIDDAERSAEDKRQALDDKLQEEVEDAERANRRKIDDLNKWLGEQTAAITLWTDREFEKQELRFARERADNEEHQNRLIEDYDNWWRERHARLDAGIAEEVAKLENFRAQVAQIISNFPQIGLRMGLTPGGLPLPAGSGRGSRGIGGGSNLPSANTRSEIVRLWILAGRDRSDLAHILPTMSPADMERLLRELQAEVGSAAGASTPAGTGTPTGVGRAHGGSVSGGGVHIVGEPLPGNKPNPELFVAPTDGFIVPISRMARATGRTPSQIMNLVKQMSDQDLMSFSDVMRRHLGIDGRQFGGPVRRGEMVQVGETSPGGPANPEIFLPVGLGETMAGLLRRQPGVLSAMASKAAANTPFVNMLPGQRLTASAGGLGPFGAGDQAGGLGRMFMTGPGIGSVSVDNSRNVTINDPQVNTGLSDREISQVKEIILRMRLEEETYE
jgi:hypothetical protein